MVDAPTQSTLLVSVASLYLVGGPITLVVEHTCSSPRISLERLHCPSAPLVDHCDRRDLCCRVQLKLSACFSSSSTSMVPYSQVAEFVHLRRNSVNSYLHIRIVHDRRLWRHPTSIEVCARCQIPRVVAFNCAVRLPAVLAPV